MDYASALSSIPTASFVPDLGKNDEKPVVSAIPGGEGSDPNVTFKNTLQKLLGDVNDKINTSDQNTRDLSTGATNDIQKVVTSVEEANLALSYTLAIRSKLLDAYSEISRLNV